MIFVSTGSLFSFLFVDEAIVVLVQYSPQQLWKEEQNKIKKQ